MPIIRPSLPTTHSFFNLHIFYFSLIHHGQHQYSIASTAPTMMIPSYMPVPTALVAVLGVAGVLWYFWEQVVGATAKLVASGWLPKKFAPWLEPDPFPAHPTLQSAIDVVAGHSLRTRHRGEEERRALADLQVLVEFTSACGMDFSQPKSWQDSFPA